MTDGDCFACVAGIYVDEYHEWDGAISAVSGRAITIEGDTE